MSSKGERISWIDGLRGIACVCIFLHHFLLAFYPAAYYGTAENSHLSGRDTVFATLPAGFILNGDFWVCVFCMVSGLVIAHQTLHAGDLKKLQDSILKRYFRLAFPLFVVSFLVWIGMQLNAFSNVKAAEYTLSPWLVKYYGQKAPLLAVFKTSFVDVWFVSNDTFSTAFWMLKDLFIGSMLSYLLAFAVKGRNNRILIGLLVLFGVYFYMNSFLACFVLGVAVSFVMCSAGKERKGAAYQMFGIVELAAGAYLGGVPTGIEAGTYYRWTAQLAFLQSRPRMLHCIGAFLLLDGIRRLPVLRAFLERKGLLLLGKISYSFYLLHIPVLFSLGTWSFMALYSGNGLYAADTCVSLVLTLLILLIVSYLFWVYIESNLNRLILRIMLLLGGNEERSSKV